MFISELGNYSSPSLGVFDLDIIYDPTILDFSVYVLGPYLGNIGLGEAMDLSLGEISPGLLNVYELSLLYANETVDPFYPPGVPPYLDYIQPSSFLLATLTFDTLALGTSPLDITRSVLGDALGNPLSAGLQSGSVNVVPEPSTFLLLAAGLVGFGYFRRRYLK